MKTTIKRKNMYQLVIEGDYNKISMKQVLEVDGFALDTFWKRLKWLLTGKVGTYMNDHGKTKTIISRT